MKTGYKAIIFFVLINILLSACGSSTQSIDMLVLTNSFSPSSTPKLIPTNTIVAQPSETGHSPNTVVVIGPHSTSQSLADECPAKDPNQPTPCSTSVFTGICIEDMQRLESPDHRWVAINCESDNKFILLNQDRTKTWSISYDQKISDSPLFISGYHFFPYRWSNDNRYLYFFIYPCCADASSEYLPFGWLGLEFPLYRMDDQNGTWNKITPEAQDLLFSPTGRRLAYINRQGSDPKHYSIVITVLDLLTGDSHQYTLYNTVAAGYMVWSDDGINLTFSSVQNPKLLSASNGYEPAYYQFDYSIHLIDMLTQTISNLMSFNNSSNNVYPVKFTDNNNLLIQTDIDSPDGVKSQVQSYNLTTGKLIDIITTPGSP